jgi:hypothetical protein
MLSKQFGHVTGRDSVLSGLHRPAAATAAIVTLAAVARMRHIVHYVAWSYDTTPTGGKLTITKGGTVVWEVAITASGPGGLSLAIIGAVNSEVVVTLASGAGAVIGIVNVQYTTESDTSR